MFSTLKKSRKRKAMNELKYWTSIVDPKHKEFVELFKKISEIPITDFELERDEKGKVIEAKRRIHIEQLRENLNKRYRNKDVTEKILKEFNIDPVMRLSSYCSKIDKFLSKGQDGQIRLAFKLFDVNNDGLICYNDVYSVFSNICHQSDSLLPDDIYLIN